jgi:tetratricopeptide (TPR) repeat protein
LSWTGFVYKRQGNFEQALEYLKRAYEFGPRHYPYPFHIALIYELLNRYNKAESFYDQAISLAPDSARNYNGKMRLYLRQGDTIKARAVLKEFSQYPNVVKDSEIMNTQVEIDVYEGNYQAALDRLSSEAVINWPSFYPNDLLKAHIYKYWKKDNLAKEHYNKARILLERKIAEKPNNNNYQSILGVAYAGLGLKDIAIHAGEEAIKKSSIVDAVAGPQRVLNLARIYIMVSKYDKALDRIEYLLSIPGPLSIPLLKIDPAWGPLRNHHRFKKLIDSSE